MNLDYLIKYLLDERKEHIEDYEGIYGKLKLYRALVNVRPPMPISDEYLKKEDEFLKSINRESIKIDSKEKIILFKGDITKLKVDTIVNPANSGGTGCYVPLHNCLDNQIGTKAGVRLRLECNEKMEKIKNLDTTKCFITKAYNLPCKHIIHACGPYVLDKLTDKERNDLKTTYINILECAKENNIKELAIPTISTGVFNFPKEDATKLAVDTVLNNSKHFKRIIFCVYDDIDYEYYKREFIKRKINI